MSSPDYVTQNEYPLDDDTTLMSTTDLHSYMTHTNDTFVQVSGFTLRGAARATAQHCAPSGYAESGFCRHVVHAAKGRTLGAGLSKTDVKMAITIGYAPMRYRWCVTAR